MEDMKVVHLALPRELVRYLDMKAVEWDRSRTEVVRGALEEFRRTVEREAGR